MTLEDQLSGWTGPSSATEQDKQKRTERMIREAVEAHDALKSASLRVYAKGSYANNTNVRSDSDVDIAVECTDAIYWGEHSKNAHPHSTPYQGEWNPSKLRIEIVAALRAKFGSEVDTSGSTAIRLRSSSARVEADIVPCFSYRYYFSEMSYEDGIKVFKTDNVTNIVNYPVQHLANGRAKNVRTNQAFKKVVRILKRVENALVKAGEHTEVSSYLIECLVYNCPDGVFQNSTWSAVIKSVVAHIYNGTQGAEPTQESDRWLEVNGRKFLFHVKQKWTRKTANDFALAVWQHLDLQKV